LYSDKTILITGGTGSLGRAIVNEAINRNAKKIIVYSRDEYTQVEMGRILDDPSIRYYIGDVRDYTRLYRVMDSVDFVVHCAALKHVDVAERDPIEAIATNIDGARHVINAAIDRGVKKVLAVSSDKAVNPINLYGATKLCADKLFIAANAYSPKKTAFSVIRFGNFVGSRGSVIEYFRRLKSKGSLTLPITDCRMTRFFIKLQDAAELCLDMIPTIDGGEVITPKMPAYYMYRVAQHIHPEATLALCGIRPGEKITEDLIIQDDANRTWDCGEFYITMPRPDDMCYGDRVPTDFHYNSLDAAGESKLSDLEVLLG